MARPPVSSPAEIQAKLRSMVSPEDQEAARQGIRDCIRAFSAIAAHLRTVDYANLDPCKVCNRKGITPAEASKAAMNCIKAADELGRYIHYEAGEADSRTEVRGLDELLKVLTKDQFNQVWKWVEDAEKAVAIQ